MSLTVGAMSMFQAALPLAGAATLIAGVLIVALTVRAESRRARTGRPVTFDPKLFTVPSMRLGSIASAAFMFYFASFMFVLTLVFQQTHGLSPAAAGAAFVPSGITFMAGSMLAPKLDLPLRTRLPIGGLVISAGLITALVGSLLAPSHAAPVAVLVVAVTLTGFGNGFVLPALITLAMQDVHADYAGMGSGTITTLQQFAAALGVALIGFVYARFAPAGLIIALSIHAVLMLGLVVLFLTTLRRESAEPQPTQPRETQPHSAHPR